MKTFLIAVLSFITLIGGHFVNRRWDRAVLFLALLLGFGILCFTVFIPTFANNPEDYLSSYGKLLNVLAGGVLLLLIISTALSVMDKNNPDTMTQKKLTLSGKIGAVLLSLITSALLFSFITVYFAYTNLSSQFDLSDENDDSSFTSSSLYSKGLYSQLKFGNGRYRSKMNEMPSGEGFLVGDITYEGKPAVGVELKLQLNDEFESESLLTDDNGRFVLRIPEGDWFVTRIETTSWKNKPKGEFLLVSGFEPKISESGYSKYNMGEPGGLEFNVTAVEPASPHIALKIHSKIIYQNEFKNRKPVVHSFKNGNIEWSGYKGASQYQIKISRVEKDGTSTSYYPIAIRNVKNSTSMALNDLASEPVENKGDEKENTYNIEIIAFDEKGDYLSQTDSYKAYSFKIKEPVKLINNIHTGLYGLDFDKQKKYRKRFEAIELLIDEKIYSAAKKLLQADMKGATLGKKEAMWGYFYASQKQCKKAKEYFDKANEIGEPGCVINKHEKLCF